MKQIKINILLLTIVVFTFSSCKKQLEVTPRQSIESSGALTTREEINASITGAYTTLKSARLYGRDLIALPEALADNGFATNKSGRLLPESNNQFNSHFTNALWNGSYNAINQINSTLEAIPTLQVIPALSPAEIALWQGQLHFLRGLYYFNLLNAYAYMPGASVPSQDKGGVPLILRGFKDKDSALAFKPSRSSVNDVYAQIIIDLKVAETNLLNNSLEKNIATKAAAQALLSRVYLYNKDFANAKLWADNSIALFGASKITDVSDYVANWRSADNRETIFQIKFAINAENIGVNESLQTSYTTLTAPALPAVTGGFGDLVPSISFLNDIGITLSGGNTNTIFTGSNAVIGSRTVDVRNLLYEPGSTGRGKSYVECTKYLGKNGFINLDNVPVSRLSELFLTRAEALATSGSVVLDEAAALVDLKYIKSRRYVGYVGSAIETADNLLTGSALLAEIIRQRRLELAFEGHRFFDFKRRGADINKSAPSTSILFFTDARVLAPIPQADVDGNPNLPQNFGY
jgi:starch-binding outer membrane protein, SusD/RagB family